MSNDKIAFSKLRITPKPTKSCDECGKLFEYDFNSDFLNESKHLPDFLYRISPTILSQIVWKTRWDGHSSCLEAENFRKAKAEKDERDAAREAYVDGLFRASNLTQAKVREMSLIRANVDSHNKTAWTGLSGWDFGKPGIALVGGTGSGKTYLLKAFAADQIRAQRRVMFSQMSELLDDLRKGFSEKGANSFDKILDRTKRADILILDDLGVESPTEFAIERTTQILDFRLTEERPTFFSSNLSGNDFAKRFPPRLMSRLNYSCDFVPCDGPDRRIKEVQKRRNSK